MIRESEKERRIIINAFRRERRRDTLEKEEERDERGIFGGEEDVQVCCFSLGCRFLEKKEERKVR